MVVTRGQVPARAEYNFLDRVRWLDMYGVVLHPVKVSHTLQAAVALSRRRDTCPVFIS